MPALRFSAFSTSAFPTLALTDFQSDSNDHPKRPLQFPLDWKSVPFVWQSTSCNRKASWSGASTGLYWLIGLIQIIIQQIIIEWRHDPGIHWWPLFEGTRIMIHNPWRLRFLKLIIRVISSLKSSAKVTKATKQYHLRISIEKMKPRIAQFAMKRTV